MHVVFARGSLVPFLAVHLEELEAPALEALIGLNSIAESLLK